MSGKVAIVTEASKGLEASIAVLFAANAATRDPVKSVRRPRGESYHGKTPVFGDARSRHLLRLAAGEDLNAKLDRALRSLLLYHEARREELSKLNAGHHPRRSARAMAPVHPRHRSR